MQTASPQPFLVPPHLEELFRIRHFRKIGIFSLFTGYGGSIELLNNKNKPIVGMGSDEKGVGFIMTQDGNSGDPAVVLHVKAWVPTAKLSQEKIWLQHSP